MDEEAVREYVEQAQATIESAPQMDEANTKAAVLRNLLDLLNWTIPDDTQLEYSVKAFGKTYKVDYALILDGTPVAFLEAKGVDTTLSDKHREQLKAYLKNEDVNLGILTNGESYEFYRREVINSKVNVNTLGTTDLDSLPDRVTTLSAFTKEAIQTDESIKILNRIQELQSARETLEADKETLATRVAQLFTENVSDSIGAQTESQAKEMIDRLVTDIDSEINHDGGRSSRSVHRQPSKQSEREEPEVENIYGIEIIKDGNALAEFTGARQVDPFVETVRYLVSKHDLISVLEPLPYIPGRTRPIIHEQTSYNGKQMKQSRELPGGNYLEVNLSSGQKQRELERLVNQLQLSIRFTGNWD